MSQEIAPKKKPATTPRKASPRGKAAHGARPRSVVTSVKRGSRLRPGELDDVVVGYLREHRAEAPLTPTAVAKGIGRSAGAVSNCLARLSKRDGEVRKARGRPHAYSIADKR